MNVLIADDDRPMISLLSTEFRKAGFATIVAFDVEEATMISRRQRIDSVILDMEMPGGSGADVIAQLKFSKRTEGIPIIVVSGSVEPDARERSLAMGADDFFPKPPDLEQLVASLRRLTNVPAPVAIRPELRTTQIISRRLFAEAIRHHSA